MNVADNLIFTHYTKAWLKIKVHWSCYIHNTSMFVTKCFSEVNISVLHNNKIISQG